MRKQPHLLIVILVATISLTACKSTSPANAYLGNWQNTRDTREQLQILQNGDNLLITINDGLNTPRTVSGTLHEGIIEINAGLGTIQITYVKATDTLTMPGSGGNVEYRRHQ